MSRLARIGGGVLVAAAMLAVTGGSHVPVAAYPSGRAMLRVAWSARPERVETCRTLGDAELAALPQHMRQRVVCEGTTARYRLAVRRDGELLASAVLRGGGLRHDRELYVFRELPVPSGRATVEVRLTRIDAPAPEEADHDDVDLDDTPAGRADAAHPAESTDRERRETDEHRRRVEDEVPASLALRETVLLAPGEVMLVTYDRERRRLRAVRGAP